MAIISRSEPQDITGWLDSGEFYKADQVAVDGNGNLVLEVEGNGDYYSSGYRISNSLSLDEIKDVVNSDITWQIALATSTGFNAYTYVNENGSNIPQALDFDDGSYVDLGMTPSVFSNEKLTVAMWIKKTDGGNVWYGYDNGCDDYRWEISSGTDSFQWNNHGSSSVHSSTPNNFPPDEWWFVVWTYDAGNDFQRIYVSGDLESDSSNNGYPLTGGSDNMRLGYHPESGDLNGMISFVAAWDIVLSDQDIADLYEDLGHMENLQTGLVLHYDINEGSGDTVYDQSGNSNDGTIYGATWVGAADWQQATKDDPIPQISKGDDLTGKYLWIKQELQTDVVTKTPELESLEYEVQTVKQSTLSRSEPDDLTDGSWLNDNYEMSNVTEDSNNYLVLDTDGSGDYYSSGYRISNYFNLGKLKGLNADKIAWVISGIANTNVKILTQINESHEGPEPAVTTIYSGSGGNEVHKIDSSGNNVWKYTEHTDDVNAVAVDGGGYVY